MLDNPGYVQGQSEVLDNSSYVQGQCEELDEHGYVQGQHKANMMRSYFTRVNGI